MVIAIKILTFVSIHLPTIIKILRLIIEAAIRFSSKHDKRDWVEEEIKILFPKMTDEEIDSWIEAVLYLARLVNVKV